MTAAHHTLATNPVVVFLLATGTLAALLALSYGLSWLHRPRRPAPPARYVPLSRPGPEREPYSGGGILSISGGHPDQEEGGSQ